MHTKRLLHIAAAALILLPTAPACWADDQINKDTLDAYALDSQETRASIIISLQRTVGEDGAPLTPYSWVGIPTEHELANGGQARVYMSERDKEECLNTIGGDSAGICSFPTTEDSQTEEPADTQAVDPYTVALTAIRHAQVHSAGLVVQPERDWVYRGVPTLAHATTPIVDTSVDIFGMTVPVRFEAQEFLFDFHSGEQPIRTTTPGSPYPNMDIQTIYQHEHPHMHVTLTTTWTAYVTHPHTGNTIQVDGALKTEEDSPPFRVVRARQRLIAPEEFGKPH